MCVHTEIALLEVHTLAQAFYFFFLLLGFVETQENLFLLFYFNIMSLSYHASLLHFSSTSLNKMFPVPHRYLHCINPFCASGGCSGLPALGSV